jgi:hypothetical protein
MNKVQLALRGLVFIGLAGTAAGCGNDLLTPSSSSGTTSPATSGVTAPGALEDNPARSSDNHPGALVASTASAIAGTLRLRCEHRSGRSKISVDGNDLSPRNGSFRARVRAAGGTVTSAAKRAVGDEVEFDFDSNRNDIAAGATRIPATFIRARSGPDVIGQLLNAQGVVVASRGVECSFR